ncbi:MAG: BON domain-containing protein, partial [Alcaligenaceae bacterium]
MSSIRKVNLIQKAAIIAGLICSTMAVSNTFAADNAVSSTSNAVAKEVTEARQETQIWTTYALSPYLRANDLKVSVRDGKATLTGTVEEDVHKELAKEIALGVKGVKDVDNRIDVKADYVAKSEPGYGDAVDDATITAAVKSKLIWSKYTSGMTTKVDTKNGRVTLSGTADSNESKEMAARLARNTKGVRSVTNNLTIDPTKPGVADKTKGVADSTKKAANDAGNAITDAWITTKVKSTFFYSSNVDGSDIDVNTVGGVVTLKGKADSGAEHALAIEHAQNVRG